MNKSRSAKWQRRLIQPPRAVIDIGSNTVRMVIYEGTARAPEVVWNEKVSARLGRDLADSGAIPEEAAEEALAALARYALILHDLGVEDVQTVATAAARDATNGSEFLARAAALGLEGFRCAAHGKTHVSGHSLRKGWATVRKRSSSATVAIALPGASARPGSL